MMHVEAGEPLLFGSHDYVRERLTFTIGSDRPAIRLRGPRTGFRALLSRKENSRHAGGSYLASPAIQRDGVRHRKPDRTSRLRLSGPNWKPRRNTARRRCFEAFAMSFPPRRIWSSVIETEIDGVLGRREALRIDGQKILQGPWNSSARPFRWTYGMTCCSISGVPRKAC